jgi:hypothetical protein
VASRTRFLITACLALAIFTPAAAAHPPALQLPWTQGESWFYEGGPHSTLGCPDQSFSCTGGKPWNSLDFGVSGPGIVRAAAAGTVQSTTQCPAKSNFVILDHGDGWHTTYYHLVDIRVHPGEHVTGGQRLGTTSTEHGCAGHADGPHVHFSVARYTGPYSWHGGRVDLDGFQIGSWIFHYGKTQYSGCATNVVTKHLVCPGGKLSNDGAAVRECGATNAVKSIVATDLDCTDARQVVDAWSQQPGCGPDGNTCHVMGFACRASGKLRCEDGEQVITGTLKPY